MVAVVTSTQVCRRLYGFGSRSGAGAPPRRGIAVVDGGRGPSWIAFDCPCRRRHRLLISLSEHIRPCWRLTGRRRPSLHPSIDVVEDGVRCHFWLTDGTIKWAGVSHERRRAPNANR